MRKSLLIPVLALAFAIVAPTASAAGTDWNIKGTYVWDVFGTYFHDITIDVQNPDGTFSGFGGYPTLASPYNQPGQTTETVTGVVDGSNISFTVTYGGPYATGSVFNMTGTIDANGHISGTSPWAWQLMGKVAIKDTDLDGVADATDNCLAVANSDQKNTDGDATGDVCDSDDDNDTVADETDNCPLVANQNQMDSDEDGKGDLCDTQNVASKMDQCKDGKWMNFGSTYKNQGQCVSSTVSQRNRVNHGQNVRAAEKSVKHTVAKSRDGMPTQSKGHMKNQ